MRCTGKILKDQDPCPVLKDTEFLVVMGKAKPKEQPKAEEALKTPAAATYVCFDRENQNPPPFPHWCLCLPAAIARTAAVVIPPCHLAPTPVEIG